MGAWCDTTFTRTLCPAWMPAAAARTQRRPCCDCKSQHSWMLLPGSRTTHLLVALRFWPPSAGCGGTSKLVYIPQSQYGIWIINPFQDHLVVASLKRLPVTSWRRPWLCFALESRPKRICAPAIISNEPKLINEDPKLRREIRTTQSTTADEIEHLSLISPASLHVNRGSCITFSFVGLNNVVHLRYRMLCHCSGYGSIIFVTNKLLRPLEKAKPCLAFSQVAHIGKHQKGAVTDIS